MGRKWGLVLLGIALALGFVVSSEVISRAALKLVKEKQITVKGFAEKKVTSDFGSWSGSFAVADPDIAAAYIKLADARGKVQDFLGKLGVKPEMITFMQISSSSVNKLLPKGERSNEIDYYRLSQSIKVSSADVKMIDRLARESTALLGQGVKFNSYEPSYIYRGLEELKIDLLTEATKNAYERAKVLAENSGGRVGSLSSASQGVFQITPADSTEVSNYGMYDTSTVEKSVKAVVTLSYTIGK